MAPITDDEWADLVAHELPKTTDPVMYSYLESRRALVAEEQKQRSGTAIL
jgi:adenosine deaminase CECR1